MQSAVAKAMSLPSFALAVIGGNPSGYCCDLNLVLADRSRAAEQVEHGGAKWKTSWYPSAAHWDHVRFNASIAAGSKKSVPPDARSSGGATSTPSRRTALERTPSPANTSKNSNFEGGAGRD